MLLKEYLQKAMKEKRDSVATKDTCFATVYRCDIVNCETGEIYFSGDIQWIAPELVNDKLVFDSVEDYGHTILFKEATEDVTREK